MSKYLNNQIVSTLEENFKNFNAVYTDKIENKDDLYNLFISFLEKDKFPIEKLTLKHISFNDIAILSVSKDSLKFCYYDYNIKDDKTTEKFNFIIGYDDNKLNLKLQSVELENNMFEKDIKMTIKNDDYYTYLEVLCHKGDCSITFTYYEEKDIFLSTIDYINDENLDKYIDQSKLIDYDRDNFQNHKDYNHYFFQYYKIGKIINNNANNAELLNEIKKTLFLLKKFSQEEIETFTLLYDIDFSVFNELSHNTLANKEKKGLKI